MPFGATPSRWCVCQFHHFRKSINCKNWNYQFMVPRQPVDYLLLSTSGDTQAKLPMNPALYILYTRQCFCFKFLCRPVVRTAARNFPLHLGFIHAVEIPVMLLGN